MAYVTFTYEVLFLLMAVFNLLFLLNLEKIKNSKRLELFKPYGLQFIIVKMIVEAFVMLTLFLSTIIYSFTLLITSVLFLIVAHRIKNLFPLCLYDFIHLWLHSSGFKFLFEYSGNYRLHILPLDFYRAV